MKIGILTLPFNNNYGGLLQSYALQSFLKQRGHDVWLIKRIPNKPNLIRKIKDLIKKILLELPVIDFNMKSFESQYMQETEIINSSNKYKLLDKYNFDAYVVGSDQVWRFAYTQERTKEYFFDFVPDKNAKKIAFSASFGIDTWEADKNTTEEISKLICNFAAVSVREKSGVDLCRKCFGYNNAIQLLDPTLLYSADFYRQLYTGIETDNGGKIGVYFLGKNEQKMELALGFAKQTGKSLFTIGKRKAGIKYYYPTVSQWIKDFDTVDYIITDSFHGMVFSIIFRKPFCVIKNKNRGLGRMVFLLEEFGLQDKLINIKEKINYDALLLKVNYNLVEDRLNFNRKLSEKFLSDMNLF